MKKIDNHYIWGNAIILGKVNFCKNVNIWSNVVIRVDNGSVEIGENSNIQENSVLHSDSLHPVSIGKNCSIGHNSTLNGGYIGNGTLIGTNVTILDNAMIGENCIIGANTLITKNIIIPNNTVVFGVPGKIIRQITVLEKLHHIKNIQKYITLAEKYSISYD